MGKHTLEYAYLGQWLAVKLEHRGQAQQKLVSVGLHMGYMCCILLEQLWVLLVGMDQRLLHLQFNSGFHIPVNNTTINISGCTVFEISFLKICIPVIYQQMR